MGLFNEYYQVVKEDDRYLIKSKVGTYSLFLNMDDVTALKVSIVKFKKIRKLAETSDVQWAGIFTCPLCVKYLNTNYIDPCERCPIYKKTHQIECHGTPYEELSNYQYKENVKKEYLATIDNEIKFLQTILRKVQK